MKTKNGEKGLLGALRDAKVGALWALVAPKYQLALCRSMKRNSPSDFETLASDSVFEEYSSSTKIPKMTEAPETDKQSYWERTWHALDFDDGTLRQLASCFFYCLNWSH